MPSKNLIAELLKEKIGLRRNAVVTFVWKFLSEVVRPGVYTVGGGLGKTVFILTILIIFTLGYPPPTPTPTPLPF
jgi:hypothetical protein